VTARLLDLEITTAIVEASLADLEARSATNVVRLDTLPATAPKVADTAVDTAVVGTGVLGLAVASKHAIPAVAMATWPVTALKGRNATTVRGCFGFNVFSPLVLLGLTSYFPSGGEVGHVSRDCPTEAKGERVCYKCKQPGHVQATCPN
jgi:hypothetical protein